MHKPDIAVIMGTRPEMIKLSHLIAELGEAAQIVHTGQHFDNELSGQVQGSLNMRVADVVLENVGGKSRSEQISTCMAALSRQFELERPKVVVVQGDTNTVSAGAQAANYAGIPVIHVEAGLRSHDRAMPEEINRLVAGVLADVHCAATLSNRDNLLIEGISAEKVALTGNTIVEAVQSSLAIPSTPGSPAKSYGLDGRRYVLATVHRPENTDSKPALERILAELSQINAPVLFVTHPRTRAAMTRFGLSHYGQYFTMIDSVAHHELLSLASNAALLISDSGGVQEECTVLKKPLLVVRRSTERQESIDAGFAQLITPDLSILEAATKQLSQPVEILESIASPFGDGLASKRIAHICRQLAENRKPADAIMQADTLYPRQFLDARAELNLTQDSWAWR